MYALWGRWSGRLTLPVWLAVVAGISLLDLTGALLVLLPVGMDREIFWPYLPFWVLAEIPITLTRKVSHG